jgi:hypothetical protein
MNLTTQRIHQYIAKRQEAGAANGTINRELGALKRMFTLGWKHTPPKVAVMPHIAMLEEHNVRSGFFEHEDFLAFAGCLAGLCASGRDAGVLQWHADGRGLLPPVGTDQLDGREALS